MPQNKQSFLTKEYRQELDGLINKLSDARDLAVRACAGYGTYSIEWTYSNLADAELNLRMFLDVATEKEL